MTIMIKLACGAPPRLQEHSLPSYKNATGAAQNTATTTTSCTPKTKSSKTTTTMMPGWGMPGMMGGGVGGGGFAPPRRFEEQYHCYSVAYADKAHLEKGDKILLPPSAFDTLARLQVDYPMLFKLTNSSAGGGAAGGGADGSGERRTHCGVLEFTAEEGCCYIPFWMMQNLLIEEEGSLLTVANVSLPKAQFVKLQPQSTDFLEISNPRVVLEHALRNYSCVTLGDVIQIPYNGRNYHFELRDVRPGPAACIIETDCEVDFDAPVGYVEPERGPPSSAHHPAPPPQRSRSNSAAAASSLASTTAATGGVDDLAINGDQQQQSEQQQTTPPKPPGIRIVDGKIVRPDDEAPVEPTVSTSMLADEAGRTGVQRNAAIPECAPEVDYWAVAAGDGARLDGKKPAVLKDGTGAAVDVRRLRAEAAARRAAAEEASAAASQLNELSAGRAVSGEPVKVTAPAAAPTVQRKNKRVGGKYSRLRSGSTAFQGSANQFHGGGSKK